MYPTPAFLMCIAEIVPAALTIAVAAADTVAVSYTHLTLPTKRIV